MSTITTPPTSSPIKTRFLVISDTHSASPSQNVADNDAYFRPPFPRADVLLHCGDMTMIGYLEEYGKTLDMLEGFDADLKLVIAGNHDITLDAEYYDRKGQNMHRAEYHKDLPAKAREMWTGERAKKSGVTYLEEGTHTFQLNNGAVLRVYASPYQPEFCDWAFPYFRNEDRYNASHQCTPNSKPIAENPVPDFPHIDVMMTHGPPLGVLDEIVTEEHVGCEHLLRAARRCKPRLHCFGHIHEAWGAKKVRWNDSNELDVKPEQHIQTAEAIRFDSDKSKAERAVTVNISQGSDAAVEFGKETLMVNASIMDVRYKPWNGPWLVDLDLEPAKVYLTFRSAKPAKKGDPFADSVILWTRASPTMENDASNITVEGTVPYFSHETEKYIKASSSPICVDWRVHESRNMTGKPVSSGRAYTTSDIDYTIKVEAGGLLSFTSYYYQFQVCGTNTTSPIGRTKTAPAEEEDVSAISLGVFSCANFPTGYFNAYGNIARKNSVDYVVHLGDYIYEDEVGVPGEDERAMVPAKEIVTLYDYRTRFALYRTDEDLKMAHETYPFITVWDDHEIANNNYRDGSSTMNNTEQSFNEFGGISFDQRKMNAVRAYFEWMPLRQVDMDDNLRIWRSFKLGKLLDLVMLDTRSYDRSITRVGWNDEYVYEISNDAGRTLMGSRQENWFFNQLSASQARGATWRVIGNQMIFSRINMTGEDAHRSVPVDVDAWDGYVASRNRTLQHLYSNNIENTVMLAGDSHQNWVSDLVWLDSVEYDPGTGAGAIGVEFAVTGTTSNGLEGGIADTQAISEAFVRDNAELQWQEGYYRGYTELHISSQMIEAMYWGCPTVATRNAFEISLGNFSVAAGGNRVDRPVGGGLVEAGALKKGQGEVRETNVTRDLGTGEWFLHAFDTMFLEWALEW
ncbi:phosphodiesterase alkaline phosphatase d [Stemphylium lycopersici]|nr:phosphodiesterase alkaline phosphatase d [Stemphylium lycopersici]